MVEAIASDEFIPRIERCFKKGDLMGAYRDEERGTWYVSLRYKDWRGESKKKMRRGFPTRREALAWEKPFKGRMAGVASMTFEDACELYLEEVAPGSGRERPRESAACSTSVSSRSSRGLHYATSARWR